MKPAVAAARPAARVLHVITDLRVGGAEMQLARLVEASAPEGSPTVLIGVVCLRSGGAIADRIEASGIRVWRLGARGPVGFARAIARLGRLLRTERVDVVVAWLYHAMIAASLPGVAPARCAVAWNVRGTVPGPSDKASTRLALRLTRWLASRPRRVIYNSLTAREEHEVLGYPAAKGAVIANGFEVPGMTVTPPAAEPALVVLVARFHPMKDFDTFLRAIALLIARGVGVRAELVGEGCEPSNAALRDLISRHGVAGAVVCTGAVRDIAVVHARAAVVCSSSAWGEGFQNVLAEAGLAGVPVVSTAVGEARTIVGDDRFVVPPGDAEALAGAIASVLSQSAPERVAAVAQRRDRLARDYGLPRMRSSYARLCMDIHSERL